MTLVPNHVVEIFGSKFDNVNVAEDHYKIMIERVRTEKCSLQQATNIILDDQAGTVTLLQAGSWWPNRSDTVVPRLLLSSTTDESASFREHRLDDEQLKTIQSAVERSLNAVRYRKGSYDFVVRLGCFALDAEKVTESQVGRTHGMAKFANSIKGMVDVKSKDWSVDWPPLAYTANSIGSAIMHLARNCITSLQKQTTFLSPLDLLHTGAPCLPL